jgi:pimeloyl-ACP methyl ester carboxylesterase
MSKVFLIPGLGADNRAYNNIDIDTYEVVSVNWIQPDKTDTLKIYAQKLINQYNINSGDIAIGNSLGGMLALEIAQIVPLKKTILISSIKTINEAPWYFLFFKHISVYKLIPGKLFTSLGFLIRLIFGKMSEADDWLFNDMLQKSSPVFLKWAMGATVNWDNQIIPPNVYTITGDKDHVFNYNLIKDAIIVKGGTHIMIFDRAKELNKILKGILEK